ncbi:hypothetical protein [Aidingimonas halophila]|uniref:Lipoprotein n=1 Tax=Aidingimonas halophila TaxID=574349 RepID=A0A1H2WZX1_9GAMM|nr:hypothetical protein [Aidingimonas halophila]GHC27793.1 hypothetical protein GCM10008094_19300 [Aidingimonas halophila]SDW85509.1 hypothetical protein SAMN05443545_10350 [Aidingimonas halophila]
MIFKQGVMKVKVVVYVVFMLIFQGCAANTPYKDYEGDLGQNERARLKGAELDNQNICSSSQPIFMFVEVNGQSTFRPQFDYNRCRYPTELLLKPGENKIRALYSYSGSTHLLRACFIAEPGKTYEPISIVSGYDIEMIIVEDVTESAMEKNPTAVSASTTTSHITAQHCSWS